MKRTIVIPLNVSCIYVFCVIIMLAKMLLLSERAKVYEKMFS